MQRSLAIHALVNAKAGARSFPGSCRTRGHEADSKELKKMQRMEGFMITMLLRAVDLPSAECLVQLGFSASFPVH